MIPVRDVVPTVLVEILRAAPTSHGKIACAWTIAVGPAIHRATDVRLLDDGLLEVRADQRWGTEVKRAVPLILERLRQMLGEGVVRKLKVTARPG